MTRYGNLDYPVLVKRGFQLGLALFVLGAVGEVLGHAMLGTLPGLVDTALLDIEVVGIRLGLLSPFVFGSRLPLTE